MRFLLTNISRLCVAAWLTLVTCGCKQTHDSATTVTPPSDSQVLTETRPVPINFILNPDMNRPAGYPEQVSLSAIEEFIADQDRKVLGQGCGGSMWEGETCGMYVNSYGVQKTPWLDKPVALYCGYAQTKTGTFLDSLMLGANTYRRPDRNTEVLTWTHNYEPEEEFNAAYRTLMGGNSVDRKQLLTKIAQSLVGLDVHRFERAKTVELKGLVEKCLTDEDSEVVSIANGILETLSADAASMNKSAHAGRP